MRCNWLKPVGRKVPQWLAARFTSQEAAEVTNLQLISTAFRPAGTASPQFRCNRPERGYEMPITLPIETAERDLRSLLEELNLGDTVTLIGSEGMPRALLVSLKLVLRETEAEADREARWDALARQVSDAWQSEKSAVEFLSEMRR
jgi:hypothetical protein